MNKRQSRIAMTLRVRFLPSGCSNTPDNQLIINPLYKKRFEEYLRSIHQSINTMGPLRRSHAAVHTSMSV